MALVDIFKLKQLGEHADPEVRKRAIRILDMLLHARLVLGGGSNVFVPRGLLTDKTEVSSRDGALMAYSGKHIEEADLKVAWSKKWAAAAAVAEEASDEKERLAATEALADTMYRDFFDGDDPFGVLEDDDEEDEVERAPRSGRRSGRGHKGSKRASKREGPSSVPGSRGGVDHSTSV